jgi:hypothetical protein
MPIVQAKPDIEESKNRLRRILEKILIPGSDVLPDPSIGATGVVRQISEKGVRRIPPVIGEGAEVFQNLIHSTLKDIATKYPRVLSEVSRVVAHAKELRPRFAARYVPTLKTIEMADLGETPTKLRATLLHELVHRAQDLTGKPLLEKQAYARTVKELMKAGDITRAEEVRAFAAKLVPETDVGRVLEHQAIQQIKNTAVGQFGRHLKATPEGFTMDLHGRAVTPTKGYAIGVTTKPFKNVQTAWTYAKAKGHDYLGAWKDGDTTYIDVVDIVNNTEGVARELGKKFKQKAIYDFANGKVITLE